MENFRNTASTYAILVSQIYLRWSWLLGISFTYLMLLSKGQILSLMLRYIYGFTAHGFIIVGHRSHITQAVPYFFNTVEKLFIIIVELVDVCYVQKLI